MKRKHIVGFPENKLAVVHILKQITTNLTCPGCRRLDGLQLTPAPADPWEPAQNKHQWLLDGRLFHLNLTLSVTLLPSLMSPPPEGAGRRGLNTWILQSGLTFLSS